MNRRKMTIEEATREWVKEFNAIPQSLIQRAYYGDNWELDGWDLEEITPEDFICQECGYMFNREETEEMEWRCHCGGEIDVVWHDGVLPMWGTMWTFGDKCDEWWAEENLEVMKQCGFRIYRSDDLGVFFGIDGAGYDFYEEHWIPLYKARGLQWHDSGSNVA